MDIFSSRLVIKMHKVKIFVMYFTQEKTNQDRIKNKQYKKNQDI